MAAKTGKHLHFLGIAGSTMSGLAAAAVGLGYTVTGTDPGAYPPASDWLEAQKITWWRTPDAAHVQGADTVVISGGTPPDDVELTAAREAGIPVVSYAELVGELAADKHRIVVAGTHGKTTTTSLIAWLLESAGRQPDFVIGIAPRNFDRSVRLSDSPVIVLEGDEYKASALDERSKLAYYRPQVLVVTSLELDHPDLFADVGEIGGRFAEVVADMPAAKRLLYATGSAELDMVATDATVPCESYGEGGDWQATGVRYESIGLAFDVQHRGKLVGHFAVALYGAHNVMNCLAGIAVAVGEGLSPEQIRAGLADFKGAARRFEMVSAPGAAVTVIDDYAHHPTEIAATIAAAKAHFGRRVVAVVRPHTFSRVRSLLDEYRRAVAAADLAFVTDIEGARESGQEASVSGQDIAGGAGKHVIFEPDRTKLVERLKEEVKPGDVVLSMTVSGYDGLAAELAKRTNKVKE